MNENITPMGVLYLIPTPLGDNSPLEVLPLSVKKSNGRAQTLYY